MMRRIAPFAALLVLASACATDSTVAPGSPDTPDDPGTPPRQIVSIAITDPGVVTDGDVITLRAVIRDHLGRVVSDVRPSWTSSDTSTASVTDEGVLQARRAGTIQLQASAQDASGTVVAGRPLTISLHPAVSLQLSDSSFLLAVGQVRGLQATLRGLDGRILLHRALAWSSSNSAVAKVSPTGEILAVGAGTAVIAARFGALLAEVHVQVPQPPVLSRYEITGADGRALPAVVDDRVENSPTGPHRYITRIESGFLRIGDPYEVQLKLVTYEVSELGGNVIMREVDRTTVTDAGTVVYDWITGAATLHSTSTGGVQHEMGTANGAPALFFRLPGTNTVWMLGLRYVP